MIDNTGPLTVKEYRLLEQFLDEYSDMVQGYGFPIEHRAHWTFPNHWDDTEKRVLTEMVSKECGWKVDADLDAYVTKKVYFRRADVLNTLATRCFHQQEKLKYMERMTEIADKVLSTRQAMLEVLPEIASIPALESPFG